MRIDLDPKTHDGMGRQFGKEYSLILTDPDFERKLESFDKNLKLMFDQQAKRWRVLEWAPDNSGWNVIVTAQDDEGNPKPLGQWILNKLYVYRHNYELRARNPNQYFDDLMYEADKQKNVIDTRSSMDHIHQLIDDRNEWRRANRERKNLPKSDVTAGYPKVEFKPKNSPHKQPKGLIYAPD